MEENSRLRKITEILEKKQTIDVHKKYHGYCPAMQNGCFVNACKSCAYLDLKNELNKLKAEKEKDE